MSVYTNNGCEANTDSAFDALDYDTQLALLDLTADIEADMIREDMAANDVSAAEIADVVYSLDHRIGWLEEAREAAAAYRCEFADYNAEGSFSEFVRQRIG